MSRADFRPLLVVFLRQGLLTADVPFELFELNSVVTEVVAQSGVRVDVSGRSRGAIARFVLVCASV